MVVETVHKIVFVFIQQQSYWQENRINVHVLFANTEANLFLNDTSKRYCWAFS